MNDVNLLGDGDWQYNGLLNPQGRVMALFYLARAASEDFCMIVPELPAEPLLASLQRFTFRSKVSLSMGGGQHARGRLLAPNSGLQAAQTDVPAVMTLRIPGRLADRVLSIAPNAVDTDAEALDQWHCLDMAAGWIWLAEPQQNRWTPQMLSLERLDAFSLNKGCYPGQEIVARTHYLGKSKRRLQAIIGAGMQIDQPLSANGREFGNVVDANSAGNFAVAVITADSPPAPWLIAAGTEVSPAAD